MGKGTEVCAEFLTDSIDCMPLGNVSDSIYSMVLMNEGTHFVYRYEVDGRGFVLDTEELHQELGPELSFQVPEVSAFILDYLRSNTA